jgi:hypothetical protein
MPFYRTYREFLQERFPALRHVRKVTLDAGFTCPNLDGTRGVGGCNYCDNRSFSPALALRGESIRQQLDSQIPKIRAKFPAAGILAYFQAYTNTYAPVETLAEIYEPALQHPDVVGLSIGTRPDCLGDDVLELLRTISRRKPLILEVGLQTANEESLLHMGRGHTAQEFHHCIQRCVKLVAEERILGFPGFDLGTHLIVGIAGENLHDFENTAQCVAQYPFSAVKIHPLHVVKGTRLAQEYLRGDLHILSFEDYCQAVARMLQIIPRTTAIERFTGDAPGESLLAPPWCGDRNAIVKRVEEILGN